MPMRRDAYPADWNDIAMRTKNAADWRCQDCGMVSGNAEQSTMPQS